MWADSRGSSLPETPVTGPTFLIMQPPSKCDPNLIGEGVCGFLCTAEPLAVDSLRSSVWGLKETHKQMGTEHKPHNTKSKGHPKLKINIDKNKGLQNRRKHGRANHCQTLGVVQRVSVESVVVPHLLVSQDRTSFGGANLRLEKRNTP